MQHLYRCQLILPPNWIRADPSQPFTTKLTLDGLPRNFVVAQLGGGVRDDPIDEHGEDTVRLFIAGRNQMLGGLGVMAGLAEQLEVLWFIGVAVDVVDLLARTGAHDACPVTFDHQRADRQGDAARIGVVAAGQHVSEAYADGEAHFGISLELPVPRGLAPVTDRVRGFPARYRAEQPRPVFMGRRQRLETVRAPVGLESLGHLRRRSTHELIVADQRWVF